MIRHESLSLEVYKCECLIMSKTQRENAPKRNNRKGFGSPTNILLAVIGLLISAGSNASCRLKWTN
jgi:hypothetical protein